MLFQPFPQLSELNIWLFHAINGSTGSFWVQPVHYLELAVILTAVILLSLMVLRAPAQETRNGFNMVLTVLLALGLSALVQSAYFTPRPFALGIGTQLSAHSPDASFPSDHATFAWSVAMGFLVSGKRNSFLLMALAACAMSWARIFLGLHFPVDILGALMVSIVAAVTVRVTLTPVLWLISLILRPLGWLRRRLPFAGWS